MSSRTPQGTFWTCLRACCPSDASETRITRCNDTCEALIQFQVPRTNLKHPNGYEWGRPLFCRFDKKLWVQFGRARTTDLSLKMFGDMGKDIQICTSKLIKTLPGNVRYIFCYDHEDEDILDFDGDGGASREASRPSWMKHECFYCNRADKVARAKSAQAQLDRLNNKKRKAEKKIEREERVHKKKREEAVDEDMDDTDEDSDDYSGTWTKEDDKE